MNPNTLIVVHGYAGDAGQIDCNLGLYEHHQRPILVLSPEDSRIEKVSYHTCLSGGKRAYTGQDSLDRQWEHLKIAYSQPFDWYLFNDADSFCLTPEIPPYLYQHRDVVYSNEVNDFRLPGQTWVCPEDPSNTQTWPNDYHAGFPLIAMQPPYFMSRWCLERMIRYGNQVADPITPFIDWYMVQVVVAAALKHQPFINPVTGKNEGASCETVTPNGKTVLCNCIREGAKFIHSVKDATARDLCLQALPK